MRKYFAITPVVIALLAIDHASAQEDSDCARAFDTATALIEYHQIVWTKAIIDGALLPEVRDGLVVVVKYARDNAINGAEGRKIQCVSNYAKPRDIVDTAVALFSAGLASISPERTAYIEPSEILNGYPLGGPNAVIPKLREQILGGDRGTVSNVLRDPWRCITFIRRC
jgi:hypothetical protein